jgi:hypothetical protein
MNEGIQCCPTLKFLLWIVLMQRKNFFFVAIITCKIGITSWLILWMRVFDHGHQIVEVLPYLLLLNLYKAIQDPMKSSLHTKSHARSRFSVIVSMITPIITSVIIITIIHVSMKRKERGEGSKSHLPSSPWSYFGLHRGIALVYPPSSRFSSFPSPQLG